jgi:hypothetical protein
MANNAAEDRAGATRRAFLSASAVTAAAVPFISVAAAKASTAPAIARHQPDNELRHLIRQIDPARIEATIQTLVSFGTRHTTYSGTNFTTLTWNANPESDLVGYEVMMRDTTAADWTSAIDVGNVTAVTLDISKDNVQFGVRAVDQAGHRSPVAFPAAVA